MIHPSLFSFSVIEECQESEMDEREEYWISYYNSYLPNGYNVCIPGTITFSEKSKDLFSQWREDKRREDLIQETLEIEEYLESLISIKMYGAEKENFKRKFFEMIRTPKDTNYKYRGIRTINAVIQEDGLSFIINSWQDRKNGNSKKQSTYWVIEKIKKGGR
jgi:hypothetical protein